MAFNLVFVILGGTIIFTHRLNGVELLFHYVL